MTQSAIEWADRHDWNPVRGCTRVTEACRNCYAENIAGRFCGAGQPFEGYATKKGGEARWTGKVELQTNRLLLPLKWRKPAKIFVNSASDIFHESLPDTDIDKIFAVMALCPQHTFQVLTKRPERMKKYFRNAPNERIAGAYEAMAIDHKLTDIYVDWPLLNVWLGVSVHDQASADEFIPLLLNTPAAKRFVSYEPALGPVDWENIETYGWVIKSLTGVIYRPYGATLGPCSRLDQIIFGGESGPNSRSPHPDWARNTQRQCAAAGTAFYLKQWGGWMPCDIIPTKCRGWKVLDEQGMALVGKKRAGRLLDGVEYSEMPV